ncbi:MAG: hypothetical protein LAO51_15770 [Acidobacteriia bacterium]|nr:hypothetical protein [Terriglobia bacterium]
MTSREVGSARPLAERPVWKALEEHHHKIRNRLRQISADDPGRGKRLNAETAGLHLDDTKRRVTDESLQLPLRLADDRGPAARIEAISGGEKVHATEQRAALHAALRAPRTTALMRRYIQSRTRSAR